jgi:predicted transglutaminase-like cysteine proteinase
VLPITLLMKRRTGTDFPLVGLLVLGVTLGLGCASLALSPALHFDYFQSPSVRDAWSPKIAGWQQREKDDPVDLALALPPVAEPGDEFATSPAEPISVAFPAPTASTPEADLRTKYAAFLGEQKRTVARQFAAWVQAEAKHHYVADGPIDHWATLEETLRANGDDCDGLELLTFRGLRELGFADDEVFRAIVYRPSDGQHHMVTLWFETPDDPWVIDPTGAMTTGMPRMSDLPSWVPLKVFGEATEYTVRRGAESSPALVANR